MSKLTRIERRQKAKEIRNQAAEIAYLRLHQVQTPNGDEVRFESSKFVALGNFSKGLTHDPATGLVKKPSDYQRFVQALNTGDSDAIGTIPNNTGPVPQMVVNMLTKVMYRKLTNPQSGLGYDLEGPDAQEHALPPAHTIDSEEAAAEMAELYWMAVLRDIPFDEFGTNPMAQDAVKDLANYPYFTAKGPGGKITKHNLFRSTSQGLQDGNYISQFLLIGNKDHQADGLTNPPVPTDGFLKYGAFTLSQQQKSALSSKDYMLEVASWLAVQNGENALPRTTEPNGKSPQDEFEPTRRFITTPRDMATYVHFDALYEAYLNACWYLLNEMDGSPPNGKAVYPVGPGNPYRNTANQEGFGTYAGPHILSLVTEVATRALKCVWFQKWFVHRRLRPEAFGGRVDFHLKSGRTLFKEGVNEYIHASLLDDMLDASRLGKYYGSPTRKFTNYFLPMAFPEGSPMHPSYGAGHATVAAACVTVLKAFFDETKEFVKPVQVKKNAAGNLDGAALELIPSPSKLTVGGELNKLAANVSIGRNMAGVHYWSDDFESRKLGEQIGIEILQEQSLTYNERRGTGGKVYFTFTRMDGKTKVTIADGEVSELPV